MTDKVVTLVESNLRRPVHETLRRIADEIEAGKYGDYVSEAALVFMGDMTEVFVFGPDSDTCSGTVLLQAGALRCIRFVERYGKHNPDDV